MIQAGRKTRISKLAEYVANEFSDKNFTLLDEIAKFESVPIHYDNYEDAFDGMLLYDTDNRDFHIHINIDNVKQNSNRGRFTLAHEFGHLGGLFDNNNMPSLMMQSVNIPNSPLKGDNYKRINVNQLNSVIDYVKGGKAWKGR